MITRTSRAHHQGDVSRHCLASRRVGLASGTALASVRCLLRQMISDFEAYQALRPRTTAWMYAAYAAHAGAYAWTLRHRHRPPQQTGFPLASVVLGSAVALVGAGMSVAGMGRFSDAAQVSGTQASRLVTDGVYRFSRNPQYTGYALALGGAALARRSPPALALAVSVVAVFAWWVPVEERHLTRTLGPPLPALPDDDPALAGTAVEPVTNADVDPWTARLEHAFDELSHLGPREDDRRQLVTVVPGDEDPCLVIRTLPGR